MAHYQHDMLHCSQKECERKDTCYRYWLGTELKNSGFQYASFYMPLDKKEMESCNHYLNLKNY